MSPSGSSARTARARFLARSVTVTTLLLPSSGAIGPHDIAGMPTVLLVLPTSTYRAADFLDAARGAGRGRRGGLRGGADAWPRRWGTGRCRSTCATCRPPRRRSPRRARRPDAIVGVDEQGVLVAAMAAEELGLRAQPAGRRRDHARQGDACGACSRPPVSRSRASATDAGFPCVVKATSLSGQPRGDPRRRCRAGCDAALAARARDRRRRRRRAGRVVRPGGRGRGRGAARRRRAARPRDLRQARSARGPVLRGDDLRDAVAASARHAGRDRTHGRRRVRAIGLVEGPIHAELRLPPDAAPVAARGRRALDRRAVLAHAALRRRHLARGGDPASRARSAAGRARTGALRRPA